MPDALTLTLDHAQDRIKRKRVSALISGSFAQNNKENQEVAGWSDSLGSTDSNGDLETWVEPVYQTLMLKPGPLFSEYRTSGTGMFARKRKSDFSFDTAASWIEETHDHSADYWLTGSDLSTEAAITSANQSKNQPIYVAFYAYSSGLDRTYLECGWNSTASSASGVSLRLFSDGEVQVWKNGELVGTGRAGGERAPANQANNFIGFLIIPFRRRELLIVSTAGGGFSHVFEDLDAESTSNTILDATKFWLYVPQSNAAAKIQVSDIGFKSSAWRASIPTFFDKAPAAGTSPTLTEYDDAPGFGTQSASASLKQSDGTTDFTANGTATEATIRVDFTSDQDSTMFVYGVEAEYEREMTVTDDSEETSLIDYCLSARLTVAESPAGTRLSTVLKSPDSIDPLDGLGLLTIGNRPLKAEIGEEILLDGMTEPARYTDSLTDETKRVMIDVRDRWKALEQYRFSSRMPLDGLTFKNALSRIVKAAGLSDTDLDIEDAPLTLPTSGRGKRGAWSVLVDVGETAAEAVIRLHNSYAANWFLGFVPAATGVKFRCRSPEDLTDDESFTLYRRRADAIADGIAEADANSHVFRSKDHRVILPEANDVYVTGLDPATWKPIIVRKVDDDSADAGLPPSMRPENWVGEYWEVAWVDPYLSSVEACNNAIDLLFPRLSVARELIEIECEMMIDVGSVPLWRGSVVKIVEELSDGEGEEVSDKWRIVAFTVDHVRESDELVWRKGRYTLEKIVDGTAKGLGYYTGGHSVDSIAQATQVRKTASTWMPKIRGGFVRPEEIMSRLGVYVATRT